MLWATAIREITWPRQELDVATLFPHWINFDISMLHIMLHSVCIVFFRWQLSRSHCVPSQLHQLPSSGAGHQNYSTWLLWLTWLISSGDLLASAYEFSEEAIYWLDLSGQPRNYFLHPKISLVFAFKFCPTKSIILACNEIHLIKTISSTKKILYRKTHSQSNT